MNEPLLGAIEAGGTKFVCAVGTPSGTLLEQTRIPTRHPAETMRDVVSFFRERGGELRGLGIGSFGPLDLKPDSPTYGYITSTPKLPWRDFDVVGAIKEAFPVPIGFDTDVNAAALAESRWGAAQGHQNILYVTVGTGIGGGALIDGSLLHGLVHPEMGHIYVPHDRQADPFPGSCPYHGDCLEGLASGGAIAARWGVPPETLPSDHPAFRLEAQYLGVACMTWICMLSPEKIILGGGVMRPEMYPWIRSHAQTLLNGYVDAPQLQAQIGEYIVPPGLGDRAGILGALALAARACGL